MHRLSVESDGIVFGYTRRQAKQPGGGRSYKSMNYHRHGGFKRGKTIWHSNFSVISEAQAFDESDFNQWVDPDGQLWWVSKDAKVTLGVNGERLAFFPACSNHPGPWHGYPVAPANDENYEVPEPLITTWEKSGVVDELVAGRMRKGKI